MHKLYITDGIVLGKRGVGEAGAYVAVLTREFGLVKAHARSSRVEKSKLRYGLEPLTQGRFTFVKGRSEWRLTGAEGALRPVVLGTLPQRKRAGRVAKLLLRLIHGEEISPALFKAVEEGLTSLVRSDEETAKHIETILVLRILASLGYLPESTELKPFIETDFFTAELAGRAKRSRALIVRAINESLSATGL